MLAPLSFSFAAHVELLRVFLAHRTEVVERLQVLLNAQRQPVDVLRDESRLSAAIGDSFFTLPRLTPALARLRGHLEMAHAAAGFTPRVLPGLHNGLIDPAEMLVRAFHLWQQTRWPGRNGRVRYAHTLFNLYVLRCLELLSLRLWGDGAAGVTDRLAQLQELLDGLWTATPPDQPMLLRDARWLIPLAQSPATDDLGAYFGVAAQIEAGLPAADRLRVHDANVRLAAGHLRSQTRYYALKAGVALDEAGVIRNTRSSNALDFALLVQDLVPLLEAYEQACRLGERATRSHLADAICQGLSPDPDLFVNRVELLGAHSMIEQLFVTADRDGQAAYTPMGLRHAGRLDEYAALIDRLAAPLLDDCGAFRPAPGTYSPYGLLYGFATDLVEHMAFMTLLPEPVPRLGLEDVFAAGDARTLSWVTRWRQLPHLPPEVIRQFDYPQQFAEDIFRRVEVALHRRVSGDAGRPPTGRILVGRAGESGAAALQPEAYDEAQLLSDRREARCILSYQTPTGWVAIRKTILTDVLDQGRDVTLAALPPAQTGRLMLVCRHLVVRAD